MNADEVPPQMLTEQFCGRGAACMECLLSLYPASYFLLPLADEPWTVFADILLSLTNTEEANPKTNLMMRRAGLSYVPQVYFRNLRIIIIKESG